MTRARTFLAAALAVLTALGAARPEQIDVLLGRLAGGSPTASDEAFDELVRLGEPAALRALETLATLADDDVLERRARARLVARAGGPACIEGALAAARSSDPAVRASMASFLGSLALGEERAADRLERLHELARDDPRLDVREAAAKALGDSGLADAPAVLNELLDELAPEEAKGVAEVLVELAGARPFLFERMRAEFAGEARLDPATLAELMRPYGRALADVPDGGSRPAERLPFLVARHHPALPVRRASLRMLDSYLDRLVELSEEERADATLAGLAADGYDSGEVAFRRAYLALAQTGDVAAAERHALALVRASSIDDAADERTYKLFGLHLLATARFALGRRDEAIAGFERVGELARALFAERDDLRPSLDRSPSFPIAAVGGSLGVDRLQLAALAEVWIALVRLEADAGDARALEHLRSAHELILTAQLHALRTDADYPVGHTIDDLLDRELAPRRLLLSNRSLPTFGPERALDLQILLGRALASVAPSEMPGFEPLAIERAPAVADPYLDDARFGLLEEIQAADLNAARRDWMFERARLYEQAARESDPTLVSREALRFHPKSLRLLAAARAAREQMDRVGEADPDVAADPEERRELYRELLLFRGPSTYALTLSGELRQDGRAEEARVLSARMLADIRDASPGMSNIGVELISARLELSISSSYTDENSPVPAEEEALKAVRRLEALENTLQQRLDETTNDPGMAKRLEAHIEQVKSMRGSALLALAVNANVRMNDTEKAMAYFERAYELDQSDFMRVLRACYRARAGKREEALAVLRTIHPAPSLYYNLACTYALLGDADTALDFLQRELRENHAAEGSRRRQKEWASEDPDLESLHDDPRFQRLVE